MIVYEGERKEPLCLCIKIPMLEEYGANYDKGIKLRYQP